MRLQITSQNNGFLIVEVMIAFSLFTLFLVSTLLLSSTTDVMKAFSIKILSEMKETIPKLDSLITSSFMDNSEFSTSFLGNDTKIFTLNSYSLAKSDYANGWGRNNCNSRIDLKRMITFFK